MTELLLGLDVGTSSVKATALDRHGAVVGRASRPTPWDAEGRGEPQEFVAVALTVLADALPAGGDVRATAVGITGFAESGVSLDGRDRPLGPILAWQDESGDEALEDLRSAFGDEALRARTGQPMGRRLSIVKLRAGGAAERPARWLNVPEWLVFALGGEPVAELSLACRTGMLGLDGAWDGELAEWAGADWQLMPAPTCAGAPAGCLRVEDAPRALRGAVLTVAGHDHVCARLGAGAGDHDTFDSWGNGEALLRTSPQPVEPPRLPDTASSIGFDVTPSRYVVMVGLGSGVRLNRVLTALEIETADRRALDAAAAQLGPDQLTDDFQLPGLAGEIAPLADDVEPAVVWRAALDEVFRRVGDGVAALTLAVGPTERVVGAGGWLRSEPIRELKTRAVSQFQVSPEPEPGAVGAARLAARAVGVATELHLSPAEAFA